MSAVLLDAGRRGTGCEAYPVDSGFPRCSVLSDPIGTVARADTDGEGAVARGIPEVVSRRGELRGIFDQAALAGWFCVQFEYINVKVKAALAAGQPAISVDTKKKELVGDFKNGGRELRRKGEPEPVRVHDFEIKGLGKVSPYGVYDIAANEGWVNVGIDADTAAFAVESIRRWWQRLGKARYPEGQRPTLTADCGGSNGARVRLRK